MFKIEESEKQLLHSKKTNKSDDEWTVEEE